MNRKGRRGLGAIIQKLGKSPEFSVWLKIVGTHPATILAGRLMKRGVPKPLARFIARVVHPTINLYLKPPRR